jgi:hypothetical protein
MGKAITNNECKSLELGMCHAINLTLIALALDFQ